MEELETTSLATQHSLLLVRMLNAGGGQRERTRGSLRHLRGHNPVWPAASSPRPWFAAHACPSCFITSMQEERLRGAVHGELKLLD